MRPPFIRDVLRLMVDRCRAPNSSAIFVTLIVKTPIIPILSMLLGHLMLALEFPLPQLKGLAIHRSIVLRVVLLLFQTFLTVLFYQVRASWWI